MHSKSLQSRDDLGVLLAKELFLGYDILIMSSSDLTLNVIKKNPLIL